MIIQWLGHSCFKIQDKIGTDGLTIITDPFDKKIGLKQPNCEANIITISHDHADHNCVSSLRGEPFIIKVAGEYDIKGILVQGVDSDHDEQKGEKRGKNIMYRIEIDGVSIAHLGDLGTTLNDKQLEVFSGTDILLVPVGGKYTIDAVKAAEVVGQIEPRIVIPMHYKIPGLTIEGLDGVEKFIKELGLKPREEDKLKIGKKELPTEDMELVLLKI